MAHMFIDHHPNDNRPHVKEEKVDKVINVPSDSKREK